MALWRVLEITVPVFGVALLGFLYARSRPADMATANRLNVHIFTPALLFHVLSEELTAAEALVVPALGAAAVVLGSGLLAWPIVRAVGWPTRVVIPPLMFNNSGNLGLPLAVFAFGEQALPLAVVLFVVEVCLHFSVGTYMLSRHADWRALVTNPILIATALGLWSHLGDWRLPELVRPAVSMLADVSIPLMLFALGVRLTDVDFRHWKVGLAGAVLCPLLGIIVALGFVEIAGASMSEREAGQLLLFGALPPAVLNYILAEHYEQRPAWVASMVVMGNLLALAAIPALLFMLPLTQG